MNVETSFAVCLFFVLLVPFAIAGLSLINVGLGRSRSAAHFVTTSLCVGSIAILVYFIFGFRVHGYSLPANMTGPLYEPLSGIPGFFLTGLGFGFGSFAAAYGLFVVALSSVIPLGTASDRWRMGASCASSLVFAGLIYPVFLWHMHSVN